MIWIYFESLKDFWKHNNDQKNLKGAGMKWFMMEFTFCYFEMWINHIHASKGFLIYLGQGLWRVSHRVDNDLASELELSQLRKQLLENLNAVNGFDDLDRVVSSDVDAWKNYVAGADVYVSFPSLSGLLFSWAPRLGGTELETQRTIGSRP